jgi:hypothetical protein
MQVSILLDTGEGKKREVFRCPQRELFRKNQWPAKPKIQAAMMAIKDMMGDEDTEEK